MDAASTAKSEKRAVERAGKARVRDDVPEPAVPEQGAPTAVIPEPVATSSDSPPRAAEPSPRESGPRSESSTPTTEQRETPLERPTPPKSIWGPQHRTTNETVRDSDARTNASPTDGESTEDAESADDGAPAWTAVARGVALFLGAFSLLNIVGRMLSPGFDANIWWADLRFLHSPTNRGLLALVACLLVLFALRPRLSQFRRGMTSVFVIALVGVSLANTWSYYNLLKSGEIRSSAPLPFSLHIAACLMVVLAGLFERNHAARRPLQERAVMVFTVLLCLVGFPLAQMYCFGKTDYRRDADVVVVPGCKALENGAPSDALADRVRTACTLYHNGLAAKLIFSGGPGAGAVHETDAMKNLAVDLGVPAEHILVDRDGLNTQSTVENTRPLIEEHGFERVMVVSHFYHLPRLKMTFQRAGVDVFTVPAEETVRLPEMPWYMARETVALWAYYIDPIRRYRDRR